MLSKFLESIFKSGKKATETVGKSMDFIDELLEKEVIVGAVESSKEISGKIVEEAGTLYQNSLDYIENKKEELSDSMMDSSETIKNVMKEGETIVKNILGHDQEE